MAEHFLPSFENSARLEAVVVERLLKSIFKGSYQEFRGYRQKIRDYYGRLEKGTF
jgi:hypothetical protein